MKYTWLFILPLILLMPISQLASAQSTLMDQLTKAYQMFTADDNQTIHNMHNMTGMMDNKSSIINQTLYSIGSKLTKAYQMFTADDNQTIHNMHNMTGMMDKKVQQIKNFIAELKFRSGFDTFVTSEPLGYGVYNIKESNEFRPGERIILYIEPKGYEYGTLHDEFGNKLYTMGFTVDFTISDENGVLLTKQEGIAFDNIVSHHKNKELFIPFTITQTSPFPAGNYIITYVIHDKNSGASFDIVKSITVS